MSKLKLINPSDSDMEYFGINHKRAFSIPGNSYRYFIVYMFFRNFKSFYFPLSHSLENKYLFYNTFSDAVSIINSKGYDVFEFNKDLFDYSTELETFHYPVYDISNEEYEEDEYGHTYSEINLSYFFDNFLIRAYSKNDNCLLPLSYNTYYFSDYKDGNMYVETDKCMSCTHGLFDRSYSNGIMTISNNNIVSLFENFKPEEGTEYTNLPYARLFFINEKEKQFLKNMCVYKMITFNSNQRQNLISHFKGLSDVIINCPDTFIDYLVSVANNIADYLDENNNTFIFTNYFKLGMIKDNLVRVL